MHGPLGERQRGAIDEAILALPGAALTGGTLSTGEFIGKLTQDAVRYLADLDHDGEVVKRCGAPP